MSIAVGLCGIAVILGTAFLWSNNRRAISWRVVAAGLGAQLFLALMILKIPGFTNAFFELGQGIAKLLDFAKEGAAFLVGDEVARGPFMFLIVVGSSIIFMSGLSAILTYYGVIQRVVQVLAWAMRKTMGISGAEALSSASSIFFGQVESQFMIRPYMPKLTNSELFCAMTVNMATIAGTVLVAYIGLGMQPTYLIAASIMSAPAGIVIAKILWPETDHEAVGRQVKVNYEKNGENVFDAFARGVEGGWKVARNVMIMVMAAVALVAMLNSMLGWGLSIFGLSLTIQDIFGGLCTPIALLMGVPWEDAFFVGKLMATEMIVNEFVSYNLLAQAIATGELSAKTQLIATIALCGFANLGSIAINIGGLSAMVPERRADIARMGLKAMIAANMATWLTAAVAGILF